MSEDAPYSRQTFHYLLNLSGEMDVPSLRKKFDDAVAPFKGKDKKTILKNSSFDRQTLTETVFSLMNVCDSLFDCKNTCSADTEKLAVAVAERTGAILKKLLPEQSNIVDPKPIAAAGIRESDTTHVLVVEDKNSEGEKFTRETWSDVVKSSISKKLKDVPVSNTTVNSQGQGCIFLPSEKACTDAQKALDEDYKLSAAPKNSSKQWPKLKVHNVPSADCTSDELCEMIVSKNPDVQKLLSDNESARLSVIFIEKKYNFAVLKVTPDVRALIMKRARVFVGMNSLLVSDHFHVERCFACQKYGHKQDSEICPAKSSGPVCALCAGSHKSSDCREKTSQLCANCASSSSHIQKKNAKFHCSSSKECPVYQRELQKLKSKTCFDEKNYM